MNPLVQSIYDFVGGLPARIVGTPPRGPLLSNMLQDFVADSSDDNYYHEDNNDLREPGMFTLFGRLPPELRNLIWQFAIFSLPSRTAQVRDSTHPGSHVHINNHGDLWHPMTLPLPALRGTCREAREMVMALSRYGSLDIHDDYDIDEVPNRRPRQTPWTRGFLMPADTLYFDHTGSWCLAGPSPLLRDALAERTEVAVPWVSIPMPSGRGGPQPVDNSWMVRAAAESMSMWQPLLHLAPKLETLMVDFYYLTLDVVVGCDIHGRRHTEETENALRGTTAEFSRPSEFLFVVDLFDDKRLDDLRKLGAVPRGGPVEFLSFDWLRDRWASHYEEPVTYQWLILQAKEQGLIRNRWGADAVFPDMNNPESWITQDGVNWEHPWVQKVVETMPTLKPVIKVQLVTTNHSPWTNGTDWALDYWAQRAEIIAPDRIYPSS